MAEECKTQFSTPQPSHQKSPEDTLKQPQVPAFSGFHASPNDATQMFPIMYPALVPGFIPSQNQEQTDRGAGIYAVPVLPFMGPVAGLSSNTLIPLTYSIPTRPSSSEAGTAGEENGQVGQGEGEGQPQPQAQPHPALQRPVVRRFQIAFQLDLLLIIKLAAVIFLFNQDGSRQRLTLLIFAASLVYLYQTGALAPLIRWLSQGMQRAAAAPQPPVRPENARQGNENGGGGGAALAEGQAGAGVGAGNQAGDNENHAVENENVVVEGGGGNHWWGIVKEIQMIVFGFITSLLPGFHHVD